MFGEILKNFRKQNKLSQRELSARIGVNYTYLSKIENGILPPPSDEVIRKLAEALSIDVDALLLAANRLPPDIPALILRSPSIADIVRLTKDLTQSEIDKILRYADSFRRG